MDKLKTSSCNSGPYSAKLRHQSQKHSVTTRKDQFDANKNDLSRCSFIERANDGLRFWHPNKYFRQEERPQRDSSYRLLDGHSERRALATRQSFGRATLSGGRRPV